MAPRDIRRRAVTAAALYGGTAAGILGTLIAVRVLGPDQFGLFTLALATASFVQLLLDTTVEEAIVKYGFRYSADGGLGTAARPLPGRAAASSGEAARSPRWSCCSSSRSPTRSSTSPDLTAPLVVAAFIPLAQAPEGIAGASMIVAGRYDLRAIFGGLADGPPARRRRGRGPVRRHVGRRRDPRRADPGSCASGYAGHRLFSRAPGRGPDRPPPRPGASCSASSSSRASARRSSRCATRSRRSPSASSRPIAQVGYFRAAQAPITGLEALSAPVRLILLTEQTRDVEHGRIAETYRSLRRYVVGATRRRARARAGRLGADAVARRVVLGDRLHPRDRCRADPAARRLPAARARLDEVVPGLDRQAGPADRRPRASRSSCCSRSSLVLGDRWGATGAAVGRAGRDRRVRRRLGRAALPAASRAPGGTLDAERAARAVKVLVVSGIWPPDVGGPASHAPEVARFLQARGHEVEVVVTAGGAGRPTSPIPCTGRAGRCPSGCGTSHSLAARLAPRAGRRRRLLDRHVRPQRHRGRARAAAASSSSSPATPRSSGCVRAGPSAGDVESFQERRRRSRRPSAPAAARLGAAPGGARLHAERLPARSRDRLGRRLRSGSA